MEGASPTISVTVLNETSAEIDADRWAELVRGVLEREGVEAPAETAVVFVDDVVMAELNAEQVGIRALALMPLPTEKRGEGLAEVAVQIQGVWVRPGDWLYADADGIVVSSQAL